MIDSLVILGDSLFGSRVSVDDAVADAERLGIDGIVAAPARGRDYVLPAANTRLAEEAAAQPAVRRLVRVDPNQGQAAVAELHRGIDELGCIGVFLNPDEEVFRIQDAEPVVRVAAERGLPVVIAAGVPLRSEPLQILELAQRVPRSQLVLTSGGQINISGLSMVDAWAALEQAPNLAVLSNGEYRQDFLERIVRDLGAERLLFASFAPYYEQAFEVTRIRSARFSVIERDLVMEGNARRLFG
ncbi:MAG: hypothetical protein JWR33_1339 [Naasia sp.]|uniref:amidohydrolase family protein n=1 Tax=Naasia sp. TaxID=2546198 RepID=UPI0026042403|nr:amidohydrolase family protein [Naasia sp.]MCU1570598.1 hypothetical protein [Naasia sp.]